MWYVDIAWIVFSFIGACYLSYPVAKEIADTAAQTAVLTATGGFLGTGFVLFALPLPLLALSSVDRSTVTINVADIRSGLLGNYNGESGQLPVINSPDAAWIKYVDGKSIRYLTVKTSDITFEEKEMEGLVAEVSVPKRKFPGWAPSFYPHGSLGPNHRVTVTLSGPPETIKGLIEKL